MNLNALHRRLLQDVLEIGNTFPFVITAGWTPSAGATPGTMSSAWTIASSVLDGADWYADQAFAEYGLTEGQISS